ncbi:MAG: hypothetical protein EBQ83_07130, partial [Burkholderiaceae bacterium]|nr:hypothetical protein [Burkholderiaceae bacterium]
PRAEAIALWQQLQTAAVFPALECGFLAANTLRIEAGFILFCNELIEPRTLAALGKLDSAEKEGNLGGLREILVGLHFLPGTKVEDNASKLAHVIAPHIQVTSRAFSPQLGHEIGLGFIDQAALINGEAGDQTGALVRSPLNSPLGPFI